MFLNNKTNENVLKTFIYNTKKRKTFKKLNISKFKTIKIVRHLECLKSVGEQVDGRKTGVVDWKTSFQSLSVSIHQF